MRILDAHAPNNPSVHLSKSAHRVDLHNLVHDFLGLACQVPETHTLQVQNREGRADLVARNLQYNANAELIEDHFECTQ